MNEFLSTLLQAVLIAAVPVCAAFIGKGLKALASYLGQKSENDMAKKYLADIRHGGGHRRDVYQPDLRGRAEKVREFTKENQEEALWLAVGIAKNLMTVEARAFLENAYGDLNTYLQSRIEAEVRNQKTGVGTLTLGI